MADRLGIYLRAIRILGETRLASLADNRTIRYELDSIWDNGGREHCLEMGLWNFAMRSVKGAIDPDVTPDFGYEFAFSKPDDWVRTAAFCSDEYFQVPITQYEDEARHWFAEQNEVYIKYVSKGDDFGLNLGLWPESFTYAVACYFALEAAPQHTRSEKHIERLEDRCRRAFVDARSKDAMNEPTKFFALGTWVASRRGRRGSQRFDRGSRGTLIG